MRGASWRMFRAEEMESRSFEGKDISRVSPSLSRKSFVEKSDEELNGLSPSDDRDFFLSKRKRVVEIT